MKENELRIGNLITYDGQIVKVTGIKNYVKDEPYDIEVEYSDGMYSEIPIEDSDLKLIELTEEWLLKFGFILNGNRFSKGSIYFWYTDNRKNIVFALAEMKEETGVYMVLKYVHQVQNLYFVLNQKELQLKQ